MSIVGEARICDPYYGVRSLESLAVIPSNSHVRFLTSHTSEKASSLSGPLSDFKREHPNVEIRILPPPNTLHDRYLLTDENLLLLGHGIKDIGNKESFIITISKSYANDLLTDLKSRFDTLWLNSIAI